MPGYCLQWIAQGFDLLLARCISEEVELDGAADLRFAHAVIVALAGVGLGWETGVFRGSRKLCLHQGIYPYLLDTAVGADPSVQNEYRKPHPSNKI